MNLHFINDVNKIVNEIDETMDFVMVFFEKKQATSTLPKNLFQLEKDKK